MDEESSPPTVMQGRSQTAQRGSSSSSFGGHLLVHHRVEQGDDVAVHLHRVRHQHGIAVDTQYPLGDAGLAVARAAVEEQRLVADQRRPQRNPAARRAAPDR